jgi:hypothetical protein
LDTVVRRIAEGVAAGRTDSHRATIESVVQHETETPRRREGRSGIGLHAGAIFPDGDSYGRDGERLTSLRLVYKFEARHFLIESTAILGFAWGGGSAEWIPVDVFVARTFGIGDWCGYLGGGIGLRSVSVEREVPREDDCSNAYCDPPWLVSDSATTLSADLGGGVIAFRTYSYQIVLELRYHYIFDDFEKAGGKGAHGFALSFGTSH